MTHCIFCKIVEGSIPSKQVFDDGEVIAFLDINPATRGHSLVVPKRHFPLIHEAGDMELGKIFLAVSHVSKMLVDKLGASGFNILINQGRHAGQVIDHFHVHVIPRYVNDNIKLVPPDLKVSSAELDAIHDAVMA